MKPETFFAYGVQLEPVHEVPEWTETRTPATTKWETDHTAKVIILATSDLHGFLPKFKTRADVYCICGDISPLDCQRYSELMDDWILSEFIPWCESLPCEKVLLVAGNHDVFFEHIYTHALKEKYFKGTKIEYLDNDVFDYKGIRFFGTPYCKIFSNWAFMRKPEELEELYSTIPYNVDVLLTHDAPYGCNDICMEEMWWNTGEHIGNPQLREAILEKKPKYNIHGHLHSTKHEWEILGSTLVRNVALVNEQYDEAFAPYVFTLESHVEYAQ